MSTTHYDSEELLIEQTVRQLDEREVVVLKDVPRFPFYGKAYMFPHTVICIITSGVGHLQYDLHEEEMKKNVVSVINQNHVFKPIDSSIDFRATLVIVSDKMVDEIHHQNFSRDHQKYRLYPSAQLTDEEVNDLLRVIDMIEIVAKDREKPLHHRHECLLFSLDILLELVNHFRFQSDYHRPTIHKGDEVFDKFCALLAEHYKTEHMLHYYARELGYTPKYFARLIRETTGVDATDWISQYIIAQAKKVIQTRPDLSIKAIGEAFGFKEQAAFTRFFTREAGIPPKEFRKGDNQS